MRISIHPAEGNGKRLEFTQLQLQSDSCIIIVASSIKSYIICFSFSYQAKPNHCATRVNFSSLILFNFNILTCSMNVENCSQHMAYYTLFQKSMPEIQIEKERKYSEYNARRMGERHFATCPLRNGHFAQQLEFNAFTFKCFQMISICI